MSTIFNEILILKIPLSSNVNLNLFFEKEEIIISRFTSRVMEYYIIDFF